MDAKETLLLVDDDELLRDHLAAVLRPKGYRLLEAWNGAAALALCAEERPDLVLLDLGLPDMNGFEVCTCLKADPATQGIPVLFLSGYLDAGDKVKAFGAGAVDYITKPFAVDEVLARVDTHLALARQRIQLATANKELERTLAEIKPLNARLIQVNEHLTRSESLKGQFLSLMRNEINNPLNVITAASAQIANGHLSPGQMVELGARIQEDSFSLDFQMKNIFCAAELEAGDATPALARVEACSVLRDAIDSFAHLTRAKQLQILLESSGAPACPFDTDAEKFRCVVANLISNAIGFSPQGGRVWVRLDLDEAGLTLEVEDEGPGIREEDHAVIFERFRQLDTGTTRTHAGHGLGLSVAKAILDLMQGWIKVSRGSTGGACFTCFFPQIQSELALADLATDGNTFYFDAPEGMEEA